MYLANARLVVRNAAKTYIANRRLDLRNAANSLQIEGKGVLPGDPYHWGGGRNTNTRPYIHNTYVYVYIYIYIFKTTKQSNDSARSFRDLRHKMSAMSFAACCLIPQTCDA